MLRMKFSASTVILIFSDILMPVRILRKSLISTGFILTIVHLDCRLSITFCALEHEDKKWTL